MSKLCECGCGGEVVNEKSRFLKGHNRPWKRKKQSEEHKLKIARSQTGKKHSEDL